MVRNSPAQTADPRRSTDEPVVRTLAEGELGEWLRAHKLGYHRTQSTTAQEIAVRRPDIELDRTWGAFDGNRCVAGLRSMPRELTVPGGATLPADAVTQVYVLPTHRRRGLLSRMIAQSLPAAQARGDACSILVAAEYPIYGRFGYGPAASTTEFEVDIARSGVDARYAGPDDGGRVELVDAEEAYRIAPELYERFRTRPQGQGTIDRPDHRWQTMLGRRAYPGDNHQPCLYALYRDAAGVAQGGLAYTVDERWEAKLPQQTAHVQELFATTPAGESALWRFVLALDWVAWVRSGLRAPDDILPQLLPDPRAARQLALADFLWLRPLDVPRMLEAREYLAPATLVLQVRDAAGYAGGRFLLEAGPDGAKCRTTRDDPELTLDVAELGALYLGEESAVRLAALGRVEETRAGAARTADVLFHTPRRPWCPEVF